LAALTAAEVAEAATGFYAGNCEALLFLPLFLLLLLLLIVVVLFFHFFLRLFLLLLKQFYSLLFGSSGIIFLLLLFLCFDRLGFFLFNHESVAKLEEMFSPAQGPGLLWQSRQIWQVHGDDLLFA
jgi:hypothetical protein